MPAHPELAMLLPDLLYAMQVNRGNKSTVTGPCYFNDWADWLAQ